MTINKDPQKTVLILEKDNDLAKSIRLYLEDFYKIYIINQPKQLKEFTSLNLVDLIVISLDYNHSDLKGHLHNIKILNPGIKIFITYFYLDDDIQTEKSILNNADDFIFNRLTQAN